MARKPPASAPKPMSDADFSRLQARIQDGLVNTTTGAGTARSKHTKAKFCATEPLDRETLAAMYRFSSICRKIVDKPVQDALSAGFTLRRSSGGLEQDAEDARQILKRFKELNYADTQSDSILRRGVCNARLYGGGGLLLGVRTGKRWDREFVPKDTQKIEYLRPVTRHDLSIDTRDAAGYPLVYRVNFGDRQLRVHRSRLILFPGAHTLEEHREKNDGWDDSVLQAPYEELISFLSAWAGVDGMFADVSQAVFKMKNMISALASASGDQAKVMVQRLQLLDMMRGAFRAVFLNAGGQGGEGEESFEVVERQTLANLDGLIQQFFLRMAAAADMPQTVFWGSSPSGMDATGDNDLVLYHNGHVKRERKDRIEPGLLRIIEVIHYELGISGEPEEWEVVWRPSYQPKPESVATTENMRISSCVQLLDKQVITPEEVALSMSEIAPELGLKIDLASRRQALTKALQEVAKREMTGGGAQPAPDVGNPERKSMRKTPSKAAGKQV